MAGRGGFRWLDESALDGWIRRAKMAVVLCMDPQRLHGRGRVQMAVSTLFESCVDTASIQVAAFDG